VELLKNLDLFDHFLNLHDLLLDNLLDLFGLLDQFLDDFLSFLGLLGKFDSDDDLLKDNLDSFDNLLSLLVVSLNLDLDVFDQFSLDVFQFLMFDLLSSDDNLDLLSDDLKMFLSLLQVDSDLDDQFLMGLLLDQFS